VIETDLSDYTYDDILSLYDSEEVLCSVIYFLHHLNLTEYNYKIYNKELLTIIHCFKQWCSELKDAVFSIQILSDYKNLQYFCTIKQLSH